ncbi:MULTISPECIES: hypothetical protein [unclassified Helicobacter]|nr:MULTISPECIES: hypothetical protein [unclassified Helicobacter]
MRSRSPYPPLKVVLFAPKLPTTLEGACRTLHLDSDEKFALQILNFFASK